jgi:antitoxin component YwqK of YwqJK toxin-antitoxin module
MIKLLNKRVLPATDEYNFRIWSEHDMKTNLKISMLLTTTLLNPIFPGKARGESPSFSHASCKAYDNSCYIDLICPSDSKLNKKKDLSKAPLRTFESICLKGKSPEGPFLRVTKYESGGIYLIEKGNYKNGKLDGSYSKSGEDVSFFGCNNIEETYQSGKKHGPFICRYIERPNDEDGKSSDTVLLKGSYSDDKPDGEWQRANGSIATYKAGIVDGLFKVKSGHMVDQYFPLIKWPPLGICSGPEDGDSPLYVGRFSNGKVSGELSVLYNKNGDAKFDDPSWIPLKTYPFDNGKLNGKVVCKYGAENMDLTAEYIDGRKNGQFKKYDGVAYGSTKLSQEGSYLNDKRSGPWTFYCGPGSSKDRVDEGSGKLKSKGNYAEDEQDGVWETYDCESGQRIALSNYLRGKLHGLSQEFDHDKGEVVSTEYLMGEVDGKVETRSISDDKILETKNFVFGIECLDDNHCNKLRSKELNRRKLVLAQQKEWEKRRLVLENQAKKEALVHREKLSRKLETVEKCRKHFPNEFLKFNQCIEDKEFEGIATATRTCIKKCRQRKLDLELKCQSCGGSHVSRLQCMNSCQSDVNEQTEQCESLCSKSR